MRLVMALLVRDAADIVRENLEFHFSLGVDLAIVADHRSRDGTTELLEGYAARGAVRLLRKGGVYDQARWMTELAQIAVEEEGADWVLPNDIDEFWMPQEGTLKQALERLGDDVGAAVCRRVNFVPTAEDGRPWWQRMTMRQRASVNQAGKPLPPKVVHRAQPGLEIRQGNHRRVPPEIGRTASLESVEVLHFQMRSYAQFERGVRQMARSLQRTKDRSSRPGPARRRQVQLLRRGELADQYAARVADAADPAAVVEDTRLRDHLASLRAGDEALPTRGLRPRGEPTGAGDGGAPGPPPAPFIVGVPRSGTTLLRLMLDAHPQLAIPAETAFIPSLIKRWRELERSGAPEDERRRACVELIRSHPRWGDLEIEADDLEAHLAAISSLELADVARAVHVVHAADRGKPRWGDKTPRYLQRMGRIKRAVPEASFVHVIRDGRDVAVSLLEVSWGPNEVVEAARQWRSGIRGARRRARRLPGDAYTEVRYEELVAEPERVLSELAAALRLPWDEAMLHYHEEAGQRIAVLARDRRTAAGGLITAGERTRQHERVAQSPRADRIERWRAQMAPADRRAFEEIAGDLLEELGYAVGD